MITSGRLSAASLFLCAGMAIAAPTAVEHNPANGVFGQPSGVSQREPEVSREGQSVDLYFRVCCQFTYDQVFVYYTTDGTEPQGGFGVPQSGTTTQVLAIGSGVSFLVNENNNGIRDWWRATIPGSQIRFGQPVRYKIAAQGGGIQLFTNGANASNVANTFSFDARIAWPGAGAGQPQPQVGYPPVRFWKEEAFIGNRFTAAMLDQNGHLWDFYFPTPGGIQGVGTRNEGYSGGPDTFPPLLPVDQRGQMHVNQAQIGLRVDGLTHWISNPAGVSYTNVDQEYLNDDTNTVRTTQTLIGTGINIEQFDFAPFGITFPQGGGIPQRHILVKRVILTNTTTQPKTVDLYQYLDPALNGGDTHDIMFWDASRGAMTAFDKTRRTVFGTGNNIQPPNEYNITTFSGYEKNVALYMSQAIKVLPTVGAATGTAAIESWRDTSGDNSQGWIATRIVLQPGVPQEVNVLTVGAHFRPEPITANIPANDGVYDNQIVPVLEWFSTTSMQNVQQSTDTNWANWLQTGTTIETPDPRYNRLMKRGLLGSALHQDEVNGGVVAGYHNGAYYYVWPRDAMWAAVTFARAGFIDEAKNAVRWMREISFRDIEPGFGINPYTGQQHRGFWKQKCTTDGFTVWGAPQIDGTAVFPWAVKWVYDMTGDSAFLQQNRAAVRDSVLAMTQDSIDSRLYFVDPPGTGPGTSNLVYSNNLWEDQYDTFTFSNANIVRGLRDAAAISTALGDAADATDATNRANTVLSGLVGRLQWDGENTDISLLGPVYPFEVLSPTDPLMVQVIDRINGVRTRFNNAEGQAKPLVNFAGFPNDQYGWTDLINRYWGDGYWGGGQPWGAGPWFLTTMWYGGYYAMRQDLTPIKQGFAPGKGDIDNHKYRLDRLLDVIGPMGLGAEQIAARQASGSLGGSLQYPGQNDFMLQTAWPNAWESMSFFVDSLMMFLDYTPSGATNTMRFAPKIPVDWGTITYRNVEMRNTASGFVHQIDTTITDSATGVVQTLTNKTGNPMNYVTTLRVPAGRGVCVSVTGGTGTVTARNIALGSIEVSGTIAAGTNALTTITLTLSLNADCDSSGTFSPADFTCFLSKYRAGDVYADCDGSGGLSPADFTCFLAKYRAGCR